MLSFCRNNCSDKGLSGRQLVCRTIVGQEPCRLQACFLFRSSCTGLLLLGSQRAKGYSVEISGRYWHVRNHQKSTIVYLLIYLISLFGICMGTIQSVYTIVRDVMGEWQSVRVVNISSKMVDFQWLRTCQYRLLISTLYRR